MFSTPGGRINSLRGFRDVQSKPRQREIGMGFIDFCQRKKFVKRVRLLPRHGNFPLRKENHLLGNARNKSIVTGKSLRDGTAVEMMGQASACGGIAAEAGFTASGSSKSSLLSMPCLGHAALHGSLWEFLPSPATMCKQCSPFIKCRFCI